MPTCHALLLVCTAAGFLLNVSLAQLTGVLSQSAEDPESLTAVISNEGTELISVLKHNTIFDVSHPSMPCQIIDGAGNRVQMVGSHVMYSGVGKDDMYDLPPGSTFTRHLNISEYVDLSGPDPGLSMAFIVTLPSSFEGLIGHDESYQIHPDALGDMSQLQLGDPSKANLVNVFLHSEPLPVAVSAIPRHPHLSERQTTMTEGGIYIQPGSASACTPAQQANLSDAILYASYLAVAAKNAANDYNDPPFSYFMPATQEANNTVSSIMSRVVGAQRGAGSAVQASCQDQLNKCDPPHKNGTVALGYAVPPRVGFDAIVVMCMTGLALPNNPWPCSGSVGQLSKAFIFLHELVQIPAVTGFSVSDLTRPNNLETAEMVNAGVVSGTNTTLDAVALSMLGSWAWDLGLGGDPWSGASCTGRFSNGILNGNLTD
ncbi:hypothetical protein MMC06_006291 [Schaereria dolodes]|nr:hypothetical protein [Schaereria dolodes]